MKTFDDYNNEYDRLTELLNKALEERDKLCDAYVKKSEECHELTVKRFECLDGMMDTLIKPIEK